MLKIENLQLDPGFTNADLAAASAAALGVPVSDILEAAPLRQALDARKKGRVRWAVSARVSVRDEAGLLRKGAVPYEQTPWRFPYRGLRSQTRPVVAGSGPAGIFCALALAGAGLRPLLVERGRPVERRTADVGLFWRTGALDVSSNVQFGEGGAGTFSDGKLTTGTRDPRQRYILEQYAAAGAPGDILFLAKPHIGTDKLRGVAANLRQTLVSLGGEILFETALADLKVKNGRLAGAVLRGPDGSHTFETDMLALAPGHSARDTFEMLHARGVELAQKNFAVGVRIEHTQRGIDMAQYGSVADFKALPAADYKLAHHGADGRGAFTFCVCPGGEVVAAASEQGGVVTNGMSAYARAGQNCNGGLLVGVGPDDFGSAHPLAGVEYQRRLERAAFALGGGGFFAPAQLLGDFLAGRASAGAGGVFPAYRPGVRWANLADCLPGYIAETLREAIPAFGKKIRGFDAADAVLTAVESRSSSPVRILRGTDLQTNIKGVFPCGEGAGYAGGIMSAAVDGIKCAEAIAGEA